MKKLILAVLLLVMAFAPPPLMGAAYRSITVADTAIGLPGLDKPLPTKVVCTLETAQIRIRMDGTAPTTTEGHVIDSGQQITITDPNSIANFKAIRTGGVSGVLKCSYF